MTFETASNISSDKIATLKKIDNSFKPGFLQDEVIGSYLLNLVRQHDQIKYCGSTEALALSHCRSVNLLWDGDGLTNIRYAFVPYNPSGRHWILIVLDVKLNKISILDALSQCYLKENKHHKLCARVGLELFLRKFNKTNITVTSTEHVLQQDSHNCGIFVCYYAKRICEGWFQNQPKRKVTATSITFH